MNFNSTDCILIMGRRGCGKSYLARKVQDIYPRKIVFDTLHEYEGVGEHVHSFDEFCNKLIELNNSRPDNFTLIVNFDPETVSSDDEFNEMLRLSYYFGNVQIVIEEVQEYSTTHQLPHWLKKLLLTGRHQNISLLFTSQRPGEINKTILSQCLHIFCGQIVEGNDLRYIASFLRQDSQKLSTLPDRQFIYFSPAGIIQINNELKNIT